MNIGLSPVDFAALSPLILLFGGMLSLLLLESLGGGLVTKKYSFFLALAALFIALYAAFVAPGSDNPLLTPWIRFDSVGRFFTIFFLMVGLGSLLLSHPFFGQFDATQGEYNFLLLSSVFGLILIGSAADFLTLFLGLETLSIALYVLCGYMKEWEISNEASFKYFLMGALAAAFTLYGIALIYGAVGTTRLDLLLESYNAIKETPQSALFLGGVAFVTLGLAFKAALVPFHVWAPDVYAGAPTPVTAFMAVGTKAGAFAAFTRVFLLALPHFNTTWNQGIAWLAYPTLVYANYLALCQSHLRRFFAYSGISHAGFLLIPIAAGTENALPSLMFYLVVYAVATFGAFAVLAFLDKRSEGVTLGDLHGLFYRSPLLAGCLTLSLLTLAGIPPTAGFFAKFYIFIAAFEAGYQGLVIVGLLTTVLSAWYYLRIISVMLSPLTEEVAAPTASWWASAVGIAACAAIVALSLYPTPLLNLFSAATASAGVP
jgi:NADH-quinone oxidoreductase subunit N